MKPDIKKWTWDLTPADKKIVQAEANRLKARGIEARAMAARLRMEADARDAYASQALAQAARMEQQIDEAA